MKIHGVLETCLYVDDLAAAERFYGDVLGLPLVSRQEGRHVFFRCGEAMLLLFEPTASNDPAGELPPHGASGAGHVAFRVAEEEFDAWRNKLEQAGVEIEKRFTWPGDGKSIYFRDPAGNSLELAMARIWGLGGP